MSKNNDGGFGCLLGILWIVLFPFMVLKELLKSVK